LLNNNSFFLKKNQAASGGFLSYYSCRLPAYLKKTNGNRLYFGFKLK